MEHVALVSLTPIFGGGEVFCARLCKLLRDDVEIHVLAVNAELARQLQDANVSVEPLKSRTRFERLRRTRQFLRGFAARFPASAVLLNGQAEANLVGYSRRLGLHPFVIRHTDLRLQSGSFKRWLYRRNAQRAEGVICVSTAVAQQHEAFLDPGKLHVIPHWVEVAPISRTPSDRFTVAYVGRLEEAKGILDLMEAVKEIPGVQLSVAGEGPLRAGLQANPRYRCVEWLGFQKDIGSVFAKADLLVNPSHSEGSSLVALEAMAAGVPCVLSDLPALRELAAGGAAVVFPAGDVPALRNVIESLRTDSARREELAATATRAIAQRHSPNAARTRYLQLLRR